MNPMFQYEFGDLAKFETMRPHLEDVVQTFIDQFRQGADRHRVAQKAKLSGYRVRFSIFCSKLWEKRLIN